MLEMFYGKIIQIKKCVVLDSGCSCSTIRSTKSSINFASRDNVDVHFVDRGYFHEASSEVSIL